MADNKKVKEVNRDDILRYPDLYQEHFSEKMLLDKIDNFVYNFLVKNKIVGECTWEDGRAVYGKIPFGEMAVYTSKTKGGIVKAYVSTTINPDEETVTVTVDVNGIHGQVVLEHTSIKHGHVDFAGLSAPMLDIQEEVTYCDLIKNDLPTEVKSRKYTPPSFIPPYVW